MDNIATITIDARTFEYMADRIEQLVATNEELSNCVAVLEKACGEWAEVSQSNYQRAKAAEAKLSKCEALLAKAVEALEKVCQLADDQYSACLYTQTASGWEHFADDVTDVARTTLAAVSETHKLNKERSDEKGQHDE